ncbi:pentapeptide repeat-containing protein [Streptomyces sp. Inha503]|uniref:pentapeptide repeat-containing protein n=1 Tax=Streptomyces sp. Inha503 TaxID=3383314 RepID=UPI0039A323F3
MSTPPDPAPSAPSWPYCGHGAEDATDPVGCRGIHVPGQTACLAHLNSAGRDAYLAGLAPGTDIDHRGTRFTAPLLNALLQALRDPTTGKPHFGTARFEGAEFAEEAGFHRARFSGTGHFGGARFSSTARFGGAHFAHDAGFEGTQFASTAWFDGARFCGGALFRHAQFAEAAWFGGVRFAGTARFGGTWFQDDARFGGAHFLGSAGFASSRFSSTAWFEGARFAADARFEDALFSGTAGFGGARFTDDVWFGGARFAGSAGFGGARFSSTARFGGAEFSDEARFDGARFSGTAWFDGARFAGDARFHRTRFADDARFGGARFSGIVGFDLAQFRGGALFSQAQFTDVARFDAALFSGTARFEGTRFADDAWFHLAQFSGDALFPQARFTAMSWLGPVVCAKTVDLSGALFEAPVTLEIAAREVRCERTRWESTATLRLRYATVDLSHAVLFFPVAVNAHPVPFTHSSTRADESLLAGAQHGVRVASVHGVDATYLVLTDTDLSDCLFSGSFHLDQLRLEGRCNFAATPTGLHFRRSIWPYWWTRRRTLAEEHHWRAQTAGQSPSSSGQAPSPRHWRTGPHHPDPGRTPDPEHLAALYRQLRKAFEDSKDEPGAADFYYGEMEMRRHDRVGTPPGERGLLWGYWLTSGYGLRASRALVWLAVAMTATIALMMGLGLPDSSPKQTASGTIPADGGRVTLTVDKQDPRLTLPADDRFTVKRFDKSLQVVLNSVVFRSSGQDLTTWGTYTEMVSRFTEPVLLALAVLAMRSRIKR